MFKVLDQILDETSVYMTAEDAAYGMNFGWWFESDSPDSVLRDAIERDTRTLNEMKCGERIRIGWHIIESVERATKPYFVLANSGMTFKVRHEVVYGEPQRGELGIDRLKELVLVSVHGEWYAIVEDTRYHEYTRLYEDGHMSQLEREDHIELHRKGMM